MIFRHFEQEVVISTNQYSWRVDETYIKVKGQWMYLIMQWIPKLMIEAGYALNSSLGFLIDLQDGAIIGTLYHG